MSFDMADEEDGKDDHFLERLTASMYLFIENLEE